ncbi:MAG TPA: SDR family oxidoreductase [Candidatus Acidoferrum sp.]|nr:SDR family oxidoreductase [Candidatus Acidoferrum sp.]
MAPKFVTLVTGSSTGFGRLFAQTLARNGHTVFATMRDPAVKNAKNAAILRDYAAKGNYEIHVVEMDVTDELSVDRAVHSVIEQAGRVDVAINNAGYALVGLSEATTVEQVRQIFDTNFLGCVRVNRAVLPFLRKQRSGLLMHISSGAGRVVIPGFGYYCATKFAMEAMAESYHYELAGQGIESCVVEPGAYKTDVFGNFMTATDHARTETYGPMAEIPEKVTNILNSSAADAQEVADAVLSIIETPAGQRKLRYRVSPSDLGTDKINEVCAQVQEGVLEAFGLTAATKFVKSSTASAD